MTGDLLGHGAVGEPVTVHGAVVEPATVVETTYGKIKRPTIFFRHLGYTDRGLSFCFEKAPEDEKPVPPSERNASDRESQCHREKCKRPRNPVPPREMQAIEKASQCDAREGRSY